MPPRSSKRSRLPELLGTRADPLDESAWNYLKQQLGPISDSYLRRLLREANVSMSPLVEGVRQNSLGDLHRSLAQLSEIYNQSPPSGQRRIRTLVIEAKEKARWALRREQSNDEKLRLRKEILLWLVTWLENPAIFPLWAGVRLSQISPAAVY